MFKQLRRLPSVQAKIEKELGSTIAGMEHSIMSKEVGCDIHRQLPAQGFTEEQVMKSLEKYTNIYIYIYKRE